MVSTKRKPMSEINVVPYIDVMLVLLVIFMATAPLLTQGVIVDLPEAASEPELATSKKISWEEFLAGCPIIEWKDLPTWEGEETSESSSETAAELSLEHGTVHFTYV